MVQFGLERGVRVLPEFDAPAHVGEGWQDTGLTVCFKVRFIYCYVTLCEQLTSFTIIRSRTFVMNEFKSLVIRSVWVNPVGIFFFTLR